MQLLQRLGPDGLRRFLMQYRNGGPGALEADDEDHDFSSVTRRRGGGKRSKFSDFPPVPSEEGRKLMDGGDFGASQCYRETLRKRKPRLANKLMMRELGLKDQMSASSVAQVCTVVRKR